MKSCVDFLSHGWQNMYLQEWSNSGGLLGNMIYIYYGTGENKKNYLWSQSGEYGKKLSR